MKTYRLAEFNGVMVSEFYFIFCISSFFFLYFFVYFMHFFFLKFALCSAQFPMGHFALGATAMLWLCYDYGLIVIWYEEVRSCVQNIQEVILILLTTQVFFL